MSSERISWLQEVADEGLCVCVDTAVYSQEALFRVCYAFTDRCYLFLQPEEGSSVVKVMFTRKTADCDLPTLAGEFSNELINQKVRLQIASETRAIRELIVAQAFAEADLLDRSLSEAGYADDPKGIAG
ncbi:MAG: His-Xaa-Ser system protein HxsD [Acidobacteriota bacterium]|nr:His-Xaa-Ser system protein HxsD [Acidobacteriota bacterium]